MKVPIQITFTDRAILHPPLFDHAENGTPVPKEVSTVVTECSWSPKTLNEREAQEVERFIAFARTNEFWQCIQALRPDTKKTATLSIIKNSDGDDPPDIVLKVPNGKPIGIELTDCSPIAAIIEKIMASGAGRGAIPGLSDAGTYHEVKAFMGEPVSMVEPHFTDLSSESRKVIDYLENQIRTKDVPGNEILLLTRSFMGGWPESEFASVAKHRICPKHIQKVAVVSQTRSTVV